MNSRAFPTIDELGGSIHPGTVARIIGDLGSYVMLGVGGTLQGQPELQKALQLWGSSGLLASPGGWAVQEGGQCPRRNSPLTQPSPLGERD